MVFFNGCKKIDTLSPQPAASNNTGQFFNLPAATAPYVARVAALLQQRNAKKEFVNRFATRNGFPVWDKVFALSKPGSAGSNFAGAASHRYTGLYPRLYSREIRL